jgi:3-oxoisoapionate kinase
MSTEAPRYGWYGDDFTGATDTLGTLAEAGQRAMLFLGVPSPRHLAAAGPLDAIGIAGAARAMPPDAMAAELEPVGRFFAGEGVRVLHYKCCSTFDSAPHIGSIGAAVRILREHVPNRFVPIIGGQPNIRRYCVFGNLFAAAGIGGEIYRIDRHPTMAVHPVTPMVEPDLRRHLAAQGLDDIAAIHYPAYALGDDALDEMLKGYHEESRHAVLLDIACAGDLAAAGRLVWRNALKQPLLAVGASSVAQAVTTAWDEPRTDTPAEPLASADGPVFLMAGSLSPVTRRQVETAKSYARIQADAMQLIGDPASLLGEVTASLKAGRYTMVITAPPAGEAANTANASRVATATAAFIAAVMHNTPVRRLGIAGGDTSSHAVKALGLWGLSYRGTLAPGVAMCRAHSDDAALDSIELMLKGGQMGPDDLFETLVNGTTKAGTPRTKYP